MGYQYDWGGIHEMLTNMGLPEELCHENLPSTNECATIVMRDLRKITGDDIESMWRHYEVVAHRLYQISSFIKAEQIRAITERALSKK